MRGPVLLMCLAAVALAARAHSESRSAAKALHDNGLAALRQGAKSNAREALQVLTLEHGSSGHCHLLAGHCALLIEGDPANAESLYGRAQTAFDEAGSAQERAEALHAFGRLYRQQQRWEEADVKYSAAVSLHASDASMAEEALFVRGKRLLVTGERFDEAARCFEAGLKRASAPWKPHFAREAASTRGLCGDAAQAAQHYELALSLGAVASHFAVGESMQTLAAHHEQANGGNLSLAAEFMRGARDAYELSASSASGSHGQASHLKHARAIEALYALGERWKGGSDGISGGSSAEHEDALPPELEQAAASYLAAMVLNPACAAAYDGLASLLTGTSRVTNFGAAHAAALNAENGQRLLHAAQRLESTAEDAGDARENAGQSSEPSASEWRRQQLEAMDATKAQVAHWSAVVATMEEQSPGRVAGSDSSKAPEAAVAALAPRPWHLPQVLSHAEEVPRVTAASASELMRHLAARKPVVVTNLQADAGFAPREAWEARALVQAAGDRVVKVSVSQSGRFDGAEDGRLWGIESDDVLVRPPETHMKLRDLLALLRRPTPESFYLEYNALHQYLGDDVRRLVPIPPQAAHLRPLLTNLWLGKGATTSPLHYDEYENLLAQVAGTKELLLFPPEDLPHLEYVARPKGVLSNTWPNTFTRRPIDAEARAARVVFAASINLTHPDEQRRAALARCTPLHCTLRPGETLLLPAFWHHEVHSHAASVAESPQAHESPASSSERQDEQPLNVAVNFWFRNETQPPAGFL